MCSRKIIAIVPAHYGLSEAGKRPEHVAHRGFRIQSWPHHVSYDFIVVGSRATDNTPVAQLRVYYLKNGVDSDSLRVRKSP